MKFHRKHDKGWVMFFLSKSQNQVQKNHYGWPNLYDNRNEIVENNDGFLYITFAASCPSGYFKNSSGLCDRSGQIFKVLMYQSRYCYSHYMGIAPFLFNGVKDDE